MAFDSFSVDGQQYSIPPEISELFQKNYDQILVDPYLSHGDVVLLAIHIIETKNKKSGTEYDELKKLFVYFGREENIFPLTILQTKNSGFLKQEGKKIYLLPHGLTRTEKISEQVIEEEYGYEPVSSYHTDAVELLNLISTTKNSNKAIIDKSTPESQFLIRILYATAITALETYLSDALRYHVYSKDKYLLMFIGEYDQFKQKKLTLPRLAGDGTNFDKTLKDFLKDCAKEEINEIIFHKLRRVKRIFSNTFSIAFPENWWELIPAVNRRHNIFHRGGKPNEGSPEKLTVQDLTEITQKVREFIDLLNKNFEDMEIKDRDSEKNKGN